VPFIHGFGLRGTEGELTLGFDRIKEYYLHALQSPFGQKVEKFYSDVSKQVQDVHGTPTLGPCVWPGSTVPCFRDWFAHYVGVSPHPAEEARRIADSKKAAGQTATEASSKPTESSGTAV
jgi:hypothetical protein